MSRRTLELIEHFGWTVTKDDSGWTVYENPVAMTIGNTPHLGSGPTLEEALTRAFQTRSRCPAQPTAPDALPKGTPIPTVINASLWYNKGQRDMRTAIEAVLVSSGLPASATLAHNMKIKPIERKLT